MEVSEQWEATKLLGALSEAGETRFYRSESNFNSEVTVHFFRSLYEEFVAKVTHQSAVAELADQLEITCSSGVG